MTTKELIRQNAVRHKEADKPFNPYTGEGAPLEREWLEIKDFYLPRQHVPKDMLTHPLIISVLAAGGIQGFINQMEEPYTPENREFMVNSLIKVRIEYDFFYWAASISKIKPKRGGSSIPFILNRPQRRLVERYERMRLKGVPIRLILLKARQWGGSTATQLYMAWIQLVHREGWYSAIVAQDSSTARKIKAMYTKLLDEYPPILLGLKDNAKLEFGSYEGSTNDSIIKQSGKKVRDTVVSVGSIMAPNSIRGGDIAMAHFSEVGMWKSTEEWNASNIIRSVSGAILNEPMTMIVYESTANGTGNFFHDEWLRAKKEVGDPEKSSMEPLFVPWFEIEMYSMKFKSEKDKIAFAHWLIDNRDNDKPNGASDPGKYYWWLWTIGATLENIHWYVNKRKDFESHADMASEYPSDDIEAFKHSGQKSFDIYKLEELKKSCCPPEFIGDVAADGIEGTKALQNIRFVKDDRGNLSIWELPDKEQDINDRYLVIVDPQKGQSKSADNSDILVLDRYWLMHGGEETVVAEWNGHIDKDLLAWKAAQIATLYGNALLVIERNTYDQEKGKAMDESEFIIDIIYDHYDNMYIYTPGGKTTEKQTKSVGWFTNGYTKPKIVHNLIAAVRELAYVEKSVEAIQEMHTYERKDNGNWGAMDKHKDDRVIVRAIGLWISKEMELPSARKAARYRTKVVKPTTYKP